MPSPGAFFVSHEPDPVLKNARREGLIIASVWLAATGYCCATCYTLGYRTVSHPYGLEDIKPILGIPSWFVWGILLPWGICALFTAWFVGFFMTDDDLGKDHTSELESDIREGGLHE